MPTLLDSVIIIDYLRGVSEAAAFVEATSAAAVSRITWIEVFAGCDAAQEAIATQIFGALRVIPLTEGIARRAVQVRRTTSLKLPDAIIYATALEHGLTLITRNTKDFNEGMSAVQIPYTVSPRQSP